MNTGDSRTERRRQVDDLLRQIDAQRRQQEAHQTRQQLADLVR